MLDVKHLDEAMHVFLQEYAQAVKCCDAAHELDPGNLKVVLRRGKASSLAGDFDEAQGAASLVLAHAGEEEAALREEAAALARANKVRRAAAAQKQRYEFTNLFACGAAPVQPQA